MRVSQVIYVFISIATASADRNPKRVESIFELFPIISYESGNTIVSGDAYLHRPRITGNTNVSARIGVETVHHQIHQRSFLWNQNRLSEKGERNSNLSRTPMERASTTCDHQEPQGIFERWIVILMRPRRSEMDLHASHI